MGLKGGAIGGGYEDSDGSEELSSTSTSTSDVDGDGDDGGGGAGGRARRRRQEVQRVWTGGLSGVVGLQKRGLRGLMEGRRIREVSGDGVGGQEEGFEDGEGEGG